MKKKTNARGKLQQYVLLGSILGLYFGWSFNPSISPTIWTIIIVSSAATIVTVLFRVWRGEREGLLLFTGKSFARYALIVALLALRYPVFQWGGRTAVMILTMLYGGLLGYWMAKKGVE